VIAVAVKPNKSGDYKVKTYSTQHWELLLGYRKKAHQIISILQNSQLYAVTHGSVARGDVTKKSDVDIFIPEVQSGFQVESALEKSNVPINRRYIVQATPNYAMKAHLEIDETITVTFPLMEMRRVEREFYQYGGEVNLLQLQVDVRVAGVDKRLMLIEPTQTGHVESSVIGREEFVAKELGVSAETVLDRVHALYRRDMVGRTGVFVKKELRTEETFELVLKKLAEANPAVRRRFKG
jgi:predicted nucleotidyltransferase